jgi:uncharacterized protein
VNDVVNNRTHHRFELEVDGHVAKIFYKLDGGLITFIQTEVPPELAGRGIGSILVRGALDQMRSEGLKVVPQCPFVTAWFGKHPECQDLLKS